MKNNSITIIGAGPIGCYLTQLLKKEGLNTMLIEEHKELGRPIHCAGLVGRGVFAETKIPLPDCILNTINGAIFYIGKEEIPVRREEVAFVIDREGFDKKLGEGLDIHFETKFLGLEKEDGRYLIETDKGYFKADMVVGADGAKSSVREFVVSNNHIEYLKGVQFRMKIKPRYSDMVEVYIKRPYFYWLIPESKEITRIGVLSKNPYQDLLEFMREQNLKGEVLERFAGIVPLTHFAPLSKDRVFLLGDSASQIKPLSYGGIYMGMRAAEMLAECICKEDFQEYETLWKKRFGREISMALKARQLFFNFTDTDIEKIFSFIKKKTNLIEQKGDFENHSLLVWELLKQPDISKDLLSIFLKIIRVQFIN